MCCGKRLRCFIALFVLAQSAVQAARPGLQPSALTTQTGGRKCKDIKKTATSQDLRTYGIITDEERCYCDYSLYPSNGCREVDHFSTAVGWIQTVSQRSLRRHGAFLSPCSHHEELRMSPWRGEIPGALEGGGGGSRAIPRGRRGEDVGLRPEVLQRSGGLRPGGFECDPAGLPGGPH